MRSRPIMLGLLAIGTAAPSGKIETRRLHYQIETGAVVLSEGDQPTPGDCAQANLSRPILKALQRLGDPGVATFRLRRLGDLPTIPPGSIGERSIRRANGRMQSWVWCQSGPWYAIETVQAP